MKNSGVPTCRARRTGAVPSVADPRAPDARSITGCKSLHGTLSGRSTLGARCVLLAASHRFRTCTLVPEGPLGVT
eukprot:11187771-Lingulodinium_polyedra.AAC.1